MRVECVGDKSQFGRLASGSRRTTSASPPSRLSWARWRTPSQVRLHRRLIAIAFVINCISSIPPSCPARTCTSHAQPHADPPDLVSSVTLAVVIIVVAVPEGLPMMIALVSGLNMKKLLKDNILIRKN